MLSSIILALSQRGNSSPDRVKGFLRTSSRLEKLPRHKARRMGTGSVELLFPCERRSHTVSEVGRCRKQGCCNQMLRAWFSAQSVDGGRQAQPKTATGQNRHAWVGVHCRVDAWRQSPGLAPPQPRQAPPVRRLHPELPTLRGSCHQPQTPISPPLPSRSSVAHNIESAQS